MTLARTLPYRLEIDDAVCRHCRRCLGAEVCKGRAFVSLDPGESPFIDMSRCMGCLKCAVTCPFEAIAKIPYAA